MNNSGHVNYNTEDTGRLMTGAGGAEGKRRLMILLISAAVIALIAIIAGVFMLKDNRYDKQIVIAEKAMMEGDYVQAEAAYAKAVDMNKREVRGREGLAYVYAVQAKFAESTELYHALYEDTNEEKYNIAARATEKGSIPYDISLAVATPWREINIEDTPYPDSFHAFLYGTTWEGYGRQSFEAGTDNPEESLHSCMTDLLFGEAVGAPADEYGSSADGYRNKYDFHFYGSQPVFFDFDETDTEMFLEKKHDPDGWFSGDYFTFDQEKFEADLRNIYNFTDEDISKLHRYGEEKHQFYVKDGLYYSENGSRGLKSMINVISVRTDGTQFCVEYESGIYDTGGVGDEIDYSQPHYTYYELIALKTIDGKPYWTVSYNREEPPQI